LHFQQLIGQKANLFIFNNSSACDIMSLIPLFVFNNSSGSTFILILFGVRAPCLIFVDILAVPQTSCRLDSFHRFINAPSFRRRFSPEFSPASNPFAGWRKGGALQAAEELESAVIINTTPLSPSRRPLVACAAPPRRSARRPSSPEEGSVLNNSPPDSGGVAHRAPGCLSRWGVFPRPMKPRPSKPVLRDLVSRHFP